MTTVIDVAALALVLLGVRRGWRAGVTTGVARTAGIVLGVVIGLAVADRVVSSRTAPVTHLLLGLFVVLGCALVGQSIGAAVTKRLPRGHGVRSADRVAGAALYGVVCAGVCSLILTTIAAIGPGAWSDAARSSVATGALRPAGAVLRRAASAVLATAPDDIAALVPAVAQPPSAAAADAVAARVRSSVLEVRADSCGTSVQGTGFVVGDGRTVVTNAHVVRGSTSVDVVDPDGHEHRAQVVAFDTAPDLALLHVDDLRADALPVVADAHNSAEAVVVGYPGGVRTTTPAAVITRLPVPGPGWAGFALHQAYVLDAPVRHGNSGSPLLDLDGRVVGVVNALSTADPDAGFATAASELRLALVRAGSSTTPVPTGTCDR